MKARMIPICLAMSFLFSLNGGVQSVMGESADDMYGIVSVIRTMQRSSRRLKGQVCAEEFGVWRGAKNAPVPARKLSRCVARFMRGKNACMDEMKATREADRDRRSLNSAAARLEGCLKKEQVLLPADFIAANAQYW